MGFYRKKPVVIEAVPASDVIRNVGSPPWVAAAVVSRVLTPFVDHIEVKTLEGMMIARPDDWIIKGVNGELYPCKPDIFAKTYEPAL